MLIFVRQAHSGHAHPEPISKDMGARLLHHLRETELFDRFIFRRVPPTARSCREGHDYKPLKDYPKVLNSIKDAGVTVTNFAPEMYCVLFCAKCGDTKEVISQHRSGSEIPHKGDEPPQENA